MDVDAILERLTGLDEDELADVLHDDPEARAFVVQQLGIEGITIAGLNRADTPELLAEELAEQWHFATSDDGGSGVSA